jgi:hypothetical protein
VGVNVVVGVDVSVATKAVKGFVGLSREKMTIAAPTISNTAAIIRMIGAFCDIF